MIYQHELLHFPGVWISTSPGFFTKVYMVKALVDKKSFQDSIESLDAYELERELCKNSLRYLCVEKLGYKDWDVCHDDLEDWFLKNRKQDFRVLLIPRYHLKTSIVTIGKTIQYILNKPNAKILLCNAVWDNARSFLDEIKSHLQNPNLTELFGSFESSKWNKDEIVIKQRKRPDKTPSIDTAGVEKTLTSQHYDYIICDDLVTRENITTPEQMLKVKKFFFDLLKLLNPVDGQMDIVGTRWHFGDLYGDLADENKIRIEKMGKEKYKFYVKSATEDGTFNSKPIFPKMWPLEKLKDLHMTIGPYEYAANMNNSPLSEKEQIFKPPIRYWDRIPDNSRYYITTDLATEDGQDYGVVMVTCLTPGNQLFVVDYKQGHFGHNEMIDHVFNYVNQYLNGQQIKKVGIESNAYQKVFLKLIEEEARKRNVLFESVPVNRHKEKSFRIKALQPRYASGNLLIKQGMVELEEELLKFPVGKHDDLLDALEMSLTLIDPSVAHPAQTYIPRQYRGRPTYFSRFLQWR